MIRKFLVQGSIYVEVEFNDEIMPDDEWRSVFYPIHTLEHLAKHLAWAIGVNKWPLSILDGWADRPDSDARASVDVDWDDVEEIKS